VEEAVEEEEGAVSLQRWFQVSDHRSIKFLFDVAHMRFDFHLDNRRPRWR
jgi:hypothetical protein